MKLGQQYGGFRKSWRWETGWILKYIAHADSQTFSKINDLLELKKIMYQ